MKTAAEFYAAFEAAGMLSPCTWTPASGPAVSAPVRFREKTADVLDGLQLSSDPEIIFPVTQFPGIAAGDTVVVTPIGTSVPRTFEVREVFKHGTGAQRRCRLGA